MCILHLHCSLSSSTFAVWVFRTVDSWLNEECWAQEELHFYTFMASIVLIHCCSCLSFIFRTLLSVSFENNGVTLTWFSSCVSRCVLTGSQESRSLRLASGSFRVLHLLLALGFSCGQQLLWCICSIWVSMFGLGDGPTNSCVFWELFELNVLPSPVLLTYTH